MPERYRQSPVSTGRIRFEYVRRQFELARAGLVPGELPDHRIAAEIPSLLRRRLQNRMPDRFGTLHHHRGGGTRAAAAAVETVPARREGAPAGVRRSSETTARPALPRLSPLL